MGEKKTKLKPIPFVLKFNFINFLLVKIEANLALADFNSNQVNFLETDEQSVEVNFLLETPKIFIQHRGHNQNKNFFFYYAVIPKVGFLKTTFLKKKWLLKKINTKKEKEIKTGLPFILSLNYRANYCATLTQKIKSILFLFFYKKNFFFLKERKSLSRGILNMILYLR